ncbi:beta-1,3-glucan-binding protein-like [Zophobas morio]|uniref:beta-1,3-glucan-binding protein-like n=1 Tax=Zophobas morio TaxID=2755281 RepID=UPI003083966F
MKLTVIVLLVQLKFSFTSFVIPAARVEECKPTGLRVSIPDIKGIKLFSFHGKINEIFNKKEIGTISANIVKPVNNRWTFYDPNINLRQTDIFYYWLEIVYFDGKHNTTYTSPFKQHVVNLNNPLPSNRTFKRESNSTCKLGVTQVNLRRVCSGKLILNENFDQRNRHLWLYEYRFSGKPDYEFVGYTPFRSDILGVSGGYLKIRPTSFRDSYITSEGEVDLGNFCTGVHGTTDCVQKPDAFIIRPPVGSAQISTRTKWSFKYGKIEIRAKLPEGDWIYPELFLNPANDVYGPGYASGQIRIAFVEGNRATNYILQGGCILGSNKAGRNYLMRSTRKNNAWSASFHVFSVKWHPGIIQVMVDNMVYANIFPPKEGFVKYADYLNLENVEKWRNGSPLAPFDKEMYVTLGVGVGGQSFEDRRAKPWRNDDPKAQKRFYEAKAQWSKTWTNSTLFVDYVKIWAL